MHEFTRRSWLQSVLAAGATGVVGLPAIRVVEAQLSHPTPFTRPLFIPAVMVPSILDPVPGTPEGLVGSGAVYHGIAPEFFPDHDSHAPDWNMSARQDFALTAVEGVTEILPGVQTPIFAYQGLARTVSESGGGIGSVATLSASFPGPTFIARMGSNPADLSPFGTPYVVRHHNALPVELSLHQHGSHAPAHSDGYPDFYVLQGKARDYFYPNVGPRSGATPGNPGFDSPQEFLGTTLWYHDHAMDVTGFNVNRGLAGYYYGVDTLEQERFEQGVLPRLMAADGTLNAESGYGVYDVPLAIKDFQLNPDGTLFYDMLDHNGHIGPIMTVNGRAQPYMTVQRRKYRFRILNACNARYLHLRLNSQTGESQQDGIPFLTLGKDTWQFPHAEFQGDFEMMPGERYDVVIDFSEVPEGADRLYLQNIMHQTQGRKPNGVDPDKEHTPLIEFRLEEDNSGLPEISVTDGTPLRPIPRIEASEIVATRRFEFKRRRGAWVVNGQFYSPRRSDAVPLRNSAERWILRGAGGWWHPIHTHLEGCEVESVDGQSGSDLPLRYRHHIEMINLEGSDEVVIRLKFRDFRGPFVTHCHTIEHEDMRMMITHDPRDAGEESLNDGIRPHNYSAAAAALTGMPVPCLPEEDLLFEHEQTLASGEIVGPGNYPKIEERGVGIPSECVEPPGDWELGEGQIRPEDPIPESQQP